MSDISISVLMPVYNSEKFLEETVQAVINQSYTNWELILVDDGSTDNSKKLCDELRKKENRIKFIDKKNTGVSDTRNVALKNAKGQYVVFVDSDDLIHKDYLKLLVNSMNKYNTDLSVCNFIERKISSTGKVDDINREFCPKEVMEMSEMKDYIMDFGNSGLLNPLWNKIYKREIIENNNITFDEKVETGEDFIFNLQYFRKTKKISFIKEMLYYYIRRNNNSITYKYIENMYEKGWEIHWLLESFLKDMGFYNEENAYVLYGNHLTGVFSAFLNLYHDNCKLTSKEKKTYIKNIISKPYVKECAANRKKDKGIIGLTSLLVRINNALLISAVFKAIALVRKVKS